VSIFTYRHTVANWSVQCYYYRPLNCSKCVYVSVFPDNNFRTKWLFT